MVVDKLLCLNQGLFGIDCLCPLNFLSAQIRVCAAQFVGAAGVRSLNATLPFRFDICLHS
jgi:hypothetical protein